MWLVVRPVGPIPSTSTQLAASAVSFRPMDRCDYLRRASPKGQPTSFGGTIWGVEAFAQMTPKPRYQTQTPKRFRGYRLQFGSSGRGRRANGKQPPSTERSDRVDGIAEARNFFGKPIGFLGWPAPGSEDDDQVVLWSSKWVMEGSLRASSSCGCAAGRLAKQTGCNEPRADL